MKKLLQIMFVFILSVQHLSAQTKNLWATTSFGGPSGYGTILKSDSTGNKTTHNWDSSLQTSDYWIVKVDSVGTFEWQKSFPAFSSHLEKLLSGMARC